MVTPPFRPVSSPVPGGFFWMDMLRGISMFAVIIHHWLMYVPAAPHSSPVLSAGAELMGTVFGTFVHLFFLLSGCGLALSFLRNEQPSWRIWAKRRLERILVPYWIVVLFTFLWVNALESVWPNVTSANGSFINLLAYLTLLRNFYPPGFHFNPTLWFMPPIVGLYIVFPFLAYLLKRHGPWVFLAISFAVTYACITAALWAGYPDDHQNSIFLFHLAEFSIGMALAFQLFRQPQFYEKFLGLGPFLAGFLFYGLSLAMVRVWTLGPAYNDAVNLAGAFLIALNAGYWAVKRSPETLTPLLKKLAGESYLMYLIHGALILYLARPFFIAMRIEMSPPVLILAGLGFYGAVYFLSVILSPPLRRISVRLVNSSSTRPNPAKG